MAIKLAINGYGRIGRNILRAIYESGRNKDEFKIIAINDLADAKSNAHLTQYDTVHGKFNGLVTATDTSLIINETDNIKVFRERDPARLPWQDLDIDIVLECSGHFANKTASQAHINAGAKKVLISAPAGSDIDATIVYGVNHTILTNQHKIVSNASCTTNCLAPLVKPLHEKYNIKSGLMTTVHAFTNDQVLIDVYHSDLHRARAATYSMIPTKTGAAAAIGLVIPELNGKLDGFAIRVPTINVSVVDLTLTLAETPSVAEINDVLTKSASTIMQINTLPLVSIDFNHNPASSIVDLTQTKALGNTIKVLAWYDNEWGFSNRMLDTASVMANL